MKLSLLFSTIILVLFLAGCSCADKYFEEPSLKFETYNDSTIEIYDINQNNILVGKVNNNEELNYAFDLHSQEMKLLVNYQSGISDTLILKYKTEIKFTNGCNYFIELSEVNYSFTKNNPTKKVSVSKNSRNLYSLGYTVFFN